MHSLLESRFCFKHTAHIGYVSGANTVSTSDHLGYILRGDWAWLPGETMAPGRYPRLPEKSEAVLVTKGAKKEVRFLVSRVAAPAILRAPTTPARGIVDWSSNAFESIFESPLIVNCESARSNLRKFRLQLRASRNCVPGICAFSRSLPHDLVDFFLTGRYG